MLIADRPESSLSTVTKEMLIERIAVLTGDTKARSERHLEAFFRTVSEALANGEVVRAGGFGSFSTQHLKAREHKLPDRTVTSPARWRLKFRPSQLLAERVNSGLIESTTDDSSRPDANRG